MSNTSLTKGFKWDVAISLCKQDIDFAKKLVKTINPALKVFFYEDNQEELISKSGPEKFAQIFKEQSRVVVVLSREEWSNSYYTEIERNAIIDRTAVKNEGYHFLMIIPLIQGETPPWYPSTQIFARPFRFSIEELAHFIEFKVAEEGGIVKTLTLEDRYQHMLDRIEEKKSIIKLQNDKKSIDCANNEIVKLKECFNKKGEFLQRSTIDKVEWFAFSEHVSAAYFCYGEYILICQLHLPDELYKRIVTTQDFILTIELSKIFGNNLENRKSLETEERIFYYTSEYQGWALPYLFEQATNKDLQVLFRNRDNTKYYDLKSPQRTEILIDNWFQRLLENSIQTIENYI